ncbi:hypothetical protein F2Q69_00022441 [Brassica cretica]|uniref:Uncharacterized protein n=1 Tax=Brassica cretica TaxID=69181 RepID=A0A8S9QFW0_BRACR|nr:hypothetical protein F2Q69_00022441 [Brassica cretica]
MILATLQHAIVEQSTKQSTQNRSTLTLPHQAIPMSHRRPMNTIPHRSTGSIRCADSGFHESFAVETVILSSNEDPTEKYSTHSFNNTPPPSIDSNYSASVDTHPHPAKRSYASVDTTPGTSIDIKAAAFEKEKGNIPIPSRDQDGHTRAMDGRILQVSREDIADILQLANGPDNLFIQPVGQASIDKVASTSFDRVTPTSLDKAPSPSIDRHYECGCRAYDIYGTRKFRLEQKDEYGVYRDESGYARSVAGEMIHVTKDNIRKILERASLFEESYICLPEHATSFTPTKLAPEIYTKDEINEMVTGICGAQEKLGDELKTLVDDTYQPLDRGYNELFRSMAEMRTEIERTTQHRSTDLDGQARAMDGRILQVSREDIADILQLANGPNNLFMQQRSIPDNIPAVPDDFPRANTTKIGSHQSYRPVGQASIDMVAPTSWEQKDEYGVYRGETGYARSVTGELIPVTKDNIRKILERAFLFEESHICLPEHATSFPPTRLAPEIYTKDEINEMVTGICGAQERLGDELKTLVDDTYQPLEKGYKELFRSMAEMRTEIESMQHRLEKEATTSPSIDASKATSIDVKPQTFQIPAEPQDLDIIRKKDPQPATSINICTVTSIDSKFAAMEDRDIGKLNDQHDFQEECSTSINRFRMASLDDKKPTEHLPYTAAEVNQITSKLYTAIDTMEERFEKRCDDIYFPFDVRLSGLDSQAECTAPATIDRHLVASIDTTSTPDDEQLIQHKMKSMHEEVNELSAYAYGKIGWHQFSIEDI